MYDYTLRIDDILPPGQAVHLIRTTLGKRRPKGLHTHDFFELIWVQNGRMRHHLSEGREDLAEGDLLFVASEHGHALQALEDHTLIVSTLFRAGLIQSIGARHAGLTGRYFWSGGPVPDRNRRNAAALADLNHAALALERGPRGPLAAEAFLLPLIDRLLAETPDLPDDAPLWLREACAAAHRPEVFRDGAAGFVRAAGKAHAHVSRTAQAVLGQSPTDYINDRRMDHAERRLIGSDDTLKEIAEDCGIPNLSHFHKLFRARFGTTPQRYRAARQKSLVQPDR